MNLGGVIKPVPRPSAESLPYWEGAKEKKLLLQHCRSCGEFWFPPAARCRHCLSADFAWDPVSGEGRIYSFVVYHRLYHPAFEDVLPYVVAIIELREGPRLLSNIVGTAWQDVRCDLPARAVFEDDGRGFIIPKFEICDGQR
jgi:uncharacterized OB-fold protein